MDCPVNPRELEAFGWLAAGLPQRRVAEQLGLPLATIESRLRSGRERMGVRSRREALRILVDGGWIDATPLEAEVLPPAAAAYMRAWDAYVRAPLAERDHMLVRELCTLALEELVSPDEGGHDRGW
jgi:DNA-binding CsgD family transcriptional regulator